MTSRPGVPGAFTKGTCANDIPFDRHLTGSGNSGPDDTFQAPAHGGIVVRVLI